MGIGKTADVKIISSVKSVVTRRSTVPVLQELVIHTNGFLAAKTLVPWGRLYDLIPGGCALSFYRKIILLFFKQRNYYVMDDDRATKALQRTGIRRLASVEWDNVEVV